MQPTASERLHRDIMSLLMLRTQFAKPEQAILESSLLSAVTTSVSAPRVPCSDLHLDYDVHLYVLIHKRLKIVLK